MPENSQERIEKRLAELPEDVRNAITDSNLDLHIQDIGRKYTLHIDQMGILQDETMLIMLGFSKPEEFAETLARDLGIKNSVAAAITEDVSHTVFEPIRESMKAFTAAKNSVVAPAAAPSAPSPAAPTTPQPVPAAANNTEVVVAPAAPLPAKITPAQPAEVMLAAPTATTIAPSAPVAKTSPEPRPYTSDPYREPTA